MKTYRKTRRHRSAKPSPSQLLRIIIIACLCLGIVAGMLAAHAAGPLSLSGMQTNTGELLHNFQNGGRLSIFTDSLIKHGKIVIIIWFLAFVPIGGFISLFIVFARGLGLGYTADFLARCYGRAGYVYAALLCIPQNIVMLPTLFFITYAAIQFILLRLREKEQVSGKRLIEYLLILLIGCSCVVLAALIETWITPLFVRGIIAKFI